MPLEGRQLAAPVDLRDLLRVGLDAEPDAVAMSSATDRMTWRELDDASDAGAQLRGARPGGGRPRRVAHAEPHPARRALPRVLPRRARDHAAQLPLRGAGDRPRARGQWRAAIVAHAERADDLAASALAGGLAADRARRDDSGDGARRSSSCASTIPVRSRSRRTAAAPRRRSSSRPAAPDRPRASPTASTRSAGWSASAVDGFELTDGRHLPPRFVDVARRLVPLGTGLVLGRRARRDRADVRRGRDPPAAACAPTHDPGHDPGRAHRARARPRRHGRRLRVAAPVPRRCRQGVARARARVPGAERPAHRRGLRHDRGGTGDAQPAARADQARLDRPAGRWLRDLRARRRDAASARNGTVGRVWIRTRSQTIGYWEQPRGDRRDPARRLARLRRPRPRRRRRLPLVLRPQEADHRARRLEHQPGEVEEALAEHPAVALVGVVGIHDEVHGENVRAYVTIQDGVERPTSHELIEFAASASATRRPRRSCSSTRCR